MTIEIVNLRRVASADFKCDRTSPLGNPFIIHDNVTRKIACEKYQKYFNRFIENNHKKPFSSRKIYLDKIIATARVQDITLGCWCTPKQCHCETIRQYVEEQIKED